MIATMCKHCERRAADNGRRGLCQTCSRDPAIRSLYPRRRNQHDGDGVLGEAESQNREPPAEEKLYHELIKLVVGAWGLLDAEEAEEPAPRRMGHPRRGRLQIPRGIAAEHADLRYNGA